MFPFLLVLSACDALDALKDEVAGLTNPLVMEAVYVGVEDPGTEVIDLSGTDFGMGAVATALLADAAAAEDLSQAPVDGAEVHFRSEANGTVPLPAAGAGKYKATGEDGLAYEDGDPVVLSVDFGDTRHTAGILAPSAVAVDVPPDHTTGGGLTVDATGNAVDTLFVVVVDLQAGTSTFDNRPTSVGDVYNLAHGDGVLVVDLPGSAFPRDSLYVVGAAGMNVTTPENLTELNTALSSFLAGKFSFYPVSTLPLP